MTQYHYLATLKMSQKPHNGDAFGLQVEQKHRRKKKKRSKEKGCDDERKDGKESRKEKKENTEARDVVAETLNKYKNKFQSGKEDHETGGSEIVWKASKKAKKRHLEDDVEKAGSNPGKQYKRLRLDTLNVSKSGDFKEKRKCKASYSSPAQVELPLTTKRKLQQNKNSKDKFCQMDEKEESDNVHDNTESRVLDKSSSEHSFMGNFVGSRSETERESRKKKKKKKDKKKERNKTAETLIEDVKTNDKIETLVKSSHRNQDKESSSCNQVAKNKHGYHEQGMLKSCDERSFLDTSNDLEQRNKMNGKRKKKKKKRKEEESNQRKQDVSFMDITGVNNRNEAINTRSEMVENVEDPNVKEKQKKKKKKKRKEEKRRKMGQDLDISNILDEKEVSNSTAVMAESIEKQKDNEKSREAMAHAEIIHETWTVPTERLKVLKEKGKYPISDCVAVIKFIYLLVFFISIVCSVHILSFFDLGIKVKTGKWSLQELRLLQSNMDKFLEVIQKKCT